MLESLARSTGGFARLKRAEFAFFLRRIGWAKRKIRMLLGLGSRGIRIWSSMAALLRTFAHTHHTSDPNPRGTGIPGQRKSPGSGFNAMIGPGTTRLSSSFYVRTHCIRPLTMGGLQRQATPRSLATECAVCEHTAGVALGRPALKSPRAASQVCLQIYGPLSRAHGRPPAMRKLLNDSNSTNSRTKQ